MGEKSPHWVLPALSVVETRVSQLRTPARSLPITQETLNRGLKHLPMEHDISVEAFHPEAVSDASPLDHRFTRSPFPTLHVCYHGVREKGTALNPRVTSAPERRRKKKKKPTSTGLGSLSSSSSSDATPSNSSSSSGGGRRKTDQSGDGGGAGEAERQ